MGSRPELEGVPDTGTPPPETNPVSREAIQENAIALASFLNDAPINAVKVLTVIPSVNYGLMYTVLIGRVRGIEEDGTVAGEFYTTDNVPIRLLGHSLELMSKKKRKKYRTIRQNLALIRAVVTNPASWGEPFNARKDN